MRKRTLAIAGVVLVLVLSLYVSQGVGGAVKPPSTGLTGTYGVQWTTTINAATIANSIPDYEFYPKVFQGTLTFDSSGLLAGVNNLIMMESRDGTMINCSNSAASYMYPNPSMTAVSVTLICNPGFVPLTLFITVVNGGREFLLVPAKKAFLSQNPFAGFEMGYVMSGRGVRVTGE